MTELTEWISAGSSVAATLITGATAWFGYRTYLAGPVEELVPEETEPNIDEGVPSAHNSRVDVFDTGKQTTTLYVTENGLACDLIYKDGREKGNRNPKWRFDPKECQNFLSGEDFLVDSGYKVKTGRFSIGPRRNWLYSKELFGDERLFSMAIKNLLTEAAAKE